MTIKKCSSFQTPSSISSSGEPTNLSSNRPEVQDEGPEYEESQENPIPPLNKVEKFFLCLAILFGCMIMFYSAIGPLFLRYYSHTESEKLPVPSFPSLPLYVYLDNDHSLCARNVRPSKEAVEVGLYNRELFIEPETVIVVHGIEIVADGTIYINTTNIVLKVENYDALSDVLARPATLLDHQHFVCQNCPQDETALYQAFHRIGLSDFAQNILKITPPHVKGTSNPETFCSWEPIYEEFNEYCFDTYQPVCHVGSCVGHFDD